MRWTLFLAISLFSSVVSGQPIVIAPTDAVPVGGFADVEIQGLSDPGSLAWTVVPETRVRVYSAWNSKDPILAIATNTEGQWSLIIAAIEDGKVWQEKVVLTVGPSPGPEPPGPKPPPVPVPGGFRVLIIRETEEQASGVLFDPDVRAFLKDKKWRIWDDDYVESNLQFVSDTWKKAYSLAKEQSNGVRPWIIVSNGKEGASQPLPTDKTALLELLRKYDVR